MTKLLLLTVLFFMIFGNTNSNAEANVESDNFDVLTLSVKGQKAYKNLKQAGQFEDTHIGIAGSLSEYIKDFGVLLDEKNADAAFKSISKDGTSAGQLYGLSGIYFTDYIFFRNAVDRHKKNDSIVMKISGCIVSDEKISNIVESNGKNVAIIKPSQTLEDFWKSNKNSYEIDIANGGYPATFKHFAQENRKGK